MDIFKENQAKCGSPVKPGIQVVVSLAERNFKSPGVTTRSMKYLLGTYCMPA